VVGLGNPGAEFQRTRHNLGAEAVATLASRLDVRLRPERGTHARVGQVNLGGTHTVLAVPVTYMNDSGLAAAALMRRYRIADVGQLVVVHDELDLPSGRVKVKVGGGTAGNNGLKSIHAHVHDPGYVRVRIGIGKPPGRQTGTDYVLHRPGRAEQESLDLAVEMAADAVEVIGADGTEAAMQRFNVDAVP
jgi:PTH1 family peptidyl-tRNA hydrolase